jgi:hypothetical protein
MSSNAPFAVLHPAVRPETDQFERALRWTLVRLTAFEKWMIVIGVSLAAGLELGTIIAVNILPVDIQGNVVAS